jgi:hypothetical protein
MKRNRRVLLSPDTGVMFIERATSERFLLAQRSETYVGVTNITGTLRSAGAPEFQFNRIIYKHLAPLERNEQHVPPGS